MARLHCQMIRTATVIVLAAAASLHAQQAMFRSAVDTVLLDVLATDRNGVVTNLTKEEVEVRDNGVVQSLTHFSGEISPLGVVLLLDTSGSLSVKELDQLRRGAAGLAATLKTQDDLRLMTFAQMINHYGAAGPQQLARIFAKLEPQGETALHDALVAGFRLSDRQDSKRPVVIALSDGEDTASWLTAANVDEAARESWAAFFGVMPQSAEGPLLEDLASLTGGATLKVNNDFANLPETFLQILERVRQRYLVAFSPSSDAKGWHDVDVRVKRPNVKIVARRGYVRR
jgi:VWFA-related protein